jgi:hypothetical protein
MMFYGTGAVRMSMDIQAIGRSWFLLLPHLSKAGSGGIAEE